MQLLIITTMKAKLSPKLYIIIRLFICPEKLSEALFRKTGARTRTEALSHSIVGNTVNVNCYQNENLIHSKRQTASNRPCVAYWTS